MTDRLTSRRGTIRVHAEVASIDITSGRATGVRLVDGERITAGRAVLADVSATALYRDLVGLHRLPGRLAGDLGRFQWDAATFKINWALTRPIPWTAADAHEAGTLHLGIDMNGLTSYAEIPQQPFLLLEQMTTADSSRSPGRDRIGLGLHPPSRRFAPERGRRPAPH